MAVEDLYKKACDAVERANYAYAVELFREVLRQNPEYPDARMALRGTERRLRGEKGGGIVGALAALPTALKTLFGDSRKKLEAFEDYLEKHPNSFWGLMKAGAAARKAGLKGEAAMLYTDAIQQKPNHKGGLRVLCEVLIENGQSAEALKYMQRLATLAPEDRDLLHELRDLEATQHMSSHQMEGADSFRDMIRDKDEADRLEQSHRMAVTKDDLRSQVPVLEQEVAENPKHPGRIVRLAQLYIDVDQVGKARDFLKEKHELLPDNYEVREKLGDAQMLLYDRAVAAAEARAEQQPDDAESKAKLDELRKRRGAFAIKEYAWRHKQHPTDKQVQMLLGQAYFDAGQYNEAIANFQSTVQDGRFAVVSARMLGRCFMAKGQFDLALSQFDSAIQNHSQMDAEGKDLLYFQAQVYEKMGKSEEALRVYKKIYSQDITFRDVAQRVESLGG